MIKMQFKKMRGNEEPTVVFTMVMFKDTWDLISEERKRTGLSKAYIVREALDYYFKHKPREVLKRQLTKNMHDAFMILKLLDPAILNGKFEIKKGCTEFFLSWDRQLIPIYEEYWRAKQAIQLASSLFNKVGKDCIYEEKIVEEPVYNSKRTRIRKEGFILRFPNGLTIDDLRRRCEDIDKAWQLGSIQEVK